MPFEEPAKNLYMPGREAAAERAKAWVRNQAQRLEISEEAVETAIRRGWLANEIDAIETAAELLLDPPARDVFGLTAR